MQDYHSFPVQPTLLNSSEGYNQQQYYDPNLMQEYYHPEEQYGEIQPAQYHEYYDPNLIQDYYHPEEQYGEIQPAQYHEYYDPNLIQDYYHQEQERQIAEEMQPITEEIPPSQLPQYQEYYDQQKSQPAEKIPPSNLQHYYDPSDIKQYQEYYHQHDGQHFGEIPSSDLKQYQEYYDQQIGQSAEKIPPFDLNNSQFTNSTPSSTPKTLNIYAILKQETNYSDQEIDFIINFLGNRSMMDLAKILVHLNKNTYSHLIAFTFNHYLHLAIKNKDSENLKYLFDLSADRMHPEIYINPDLSLDERDELVGKLTTEYFEYFDQLTLFYNDEIDRIKMPKNYSIMNYKTDDGTIVYSYKDFIIKLYKNINHYYIPDEDWEELRKLHQKEIKMFSYYDTYKHQYL